MKKLFCILLAFCLLLTSCAAPAEPSESYEPGTTDAFLHGDSSMPEPSEKDGDSEPEESASSESSAPAPSAGSEQDEPVDPLLARVHVSEPELIYTDKELKFTLDGSFCTLRQDDGSVLYWETANGSNYPPFLLYKGTEDDPLQEWLGLFEWDFGEVRHNRASTLWVQNFYQYEDGTLIGFVHREDLARNNDEGMNNFWIGLGISEDGGYHWKYLGDVLGTVMNWKMTDADGQPNMGGVPYIVHDGYFYIYYNEYITKTTRYIACARMSVEETLACAKEGTLPEVRKYDGEGWDADPFTDYGAPVIPGSTDGYMDSHADAVWCEPLGRYLMTVQTHAKGNLWMFLSEDGVHWDQKILIDSVKTGDTMHPYSTFVGLEDSSDDFSTVGAHFYLYFPRKGMGKMYDHEDVYRVEITVDPEITE